MTNQLPDKLRDPFVDLLLSVADDKLILGHRNADWTGLAPILEEDIAFSSLAQDEIAHAQALYALVGTLTDQSPDVIAFGRRPEQYRNAAIVEPPDDFNWAFAIVRQFFCDHFDALRLARLARSAYKPLADLAARLAAEEQIHVEHADAWVQRLGTGGDDSQKRLQTALDQLAPIAPSLCEPVQDQAKLESERLYPLADQDMFEQWSQTLRAVTDVAGLTLVLEPPSLETPGGRRGHHTEHLKSLLDEMCEVYRLEPEAAW